MDTPISQLSRVVYRLSLNDMLLYLQTSFQ
nr:MAG TPA: hypothetical protein [Caudoviricetes sp.]